jgi:hypothetical protein
MGDPVVKPIAPKSARRRGGRTAHSQGRMRKVSGALGISVMLKNDSTEELGKICKMSKSVQTLV